MNKFINPVEMDLVKSIPALQGVNMEGVQPFDGLTGHYKQLGVAIGNLSKGLYEAQQTREYNKLMIEMDNINQDTTMQIQSQLGADWASTEEGRKAAIDLMNSGIQKQKDLILSNKTNYPEDKWMQLDNYFKRSTYGQLETMQTNVHQGYIKQSMQEFGLSRAMFDNRINGILATNILNQKWTFPQEQIDNAIMNDFKYLESNKAILQETGVKEQKVKSLVRVFTGMLDSGFKKSIINDTQNPAFFTILTDANGKEVYDDDGNPVYLKDEGGNPVQNIAKKSEAVQERAKETIEQIMSGETASQWKQRYKLSDDEGEFLDNLFKSEGLDAVNKSVYEMSRYLSEQKKGEDEKKLSIYNSADEKARVAYNNTVKEYNDSNNLVDLYGIVSGTVQTPSYFVKDQIDPVSGKVVAPSPLKDLTGMSLEDMNSNSMVVGGLISKSNADNFNKAMNSDTPAESLKTAFQGSLQEFNGTNEKEAWFLAMGAEYQNKISEKAIRAIATDNPTPYDEKMAKFVDDTLRYKKLYNTEYNSAMTFVDPKLNATYNEFKASAGAVPVVEAVMMNVGSNTENLANQFPVLKEALQTFQNARAEGGRVDPKTFTQGIVAAMAQDPKLKEYVYSLIPIAADVVMPSRVYNRYKPTEQQAKDLAVRAGIRARDEEIEKSALRLGISPNKFKELTEDKPGKTVIEKSVLDKYKRSSWD